MPVTVASLATAAVLYPAVGDWLGERESRREEAAYERRVAPALAALRGIRVEGLDQTCPALDHGICLAGEVPPRVASARVEKALRDAGATDVTASCRELRSGTTVLCRVHGPWSGVDVNAMVTPRWVAHETTKTTEVLANVSYGI